MHSRYIWTIENEIIKSEVCLCSKLQGLLSEGRGFLIFSFENKFLHSPSKTKSSLQRLESLNLNLKASNFLFPVI